MWEAKEVIHNRANCDMPITYDTCTSGGALNISEGPMSPLSSKSDGSRSAIWQSSSRMRGGSPNAADVCWSRTFE